MVGSFWLRIPSRRLDAKADVMRPSLFKASDRKCAGSVLVANSTLKFLANSEWEHVCVCGHEYIYIYICMSYVVSMHLSTYVSMYLCVYVSMNL